MNLAIVTFLAVCVAISTFGSVDSINCYQCGFGIPNSSPCDDPLDKGKFKSTPCASPLDACMKNSIKGVVSRNCAMKSAALNGKMECINLKDAHTCFCDGNDCNGSGTITPGFFVMGMTAAFMAVYRFC